MKKKLILQKTVKHFKKQQSKENVVFDTLQERFKLEGLKR